MNRKLTTVLFSFLVCLATGGSTFAQEDATLETVRAKMDEMFQEIKPEHVDVSQIDGWYKVQKGSIVAYVSADGRYLLQGDLIDLDEQVNLTERSRVDARRELVSSIDDSQGILFSPQEIKYRVTVFTDVDCTYCRKLHSQIEDYLAQGIEVRYLLYPRNGPASPSWSTSEDVWCARDRQGALTAAKLDHSFESQTCDASKVTESYMLGQDVGLTGTPAIVLDDGTLISGYLPPDALTARLQQAAAAK
tara:strand:- start:8469 stop:9212 length:744 start_codon:yes stop_codon:yes gene_type:complete